MSVSRAHCRDQLQALFHRELHCAARLRALLDEENEALTDRQTERLEGLIQDKHTLMQEFETLENERGRILAAVGFRADQVETCIERCDGPDGQLASTWKRLLDQVRACQHSNRKIGATVEVSRRHVQQALGVLRGQSPQANLYNPSGTSNTPFAATRTLGKV